MWHTILCVMNQRNDTLVEQHNIELENKLTAVIMILTPHPMVTRGAE